jgi:hypothetical protein
MVFFTCQEKKQKFTFFSLLNRLRNPLVFRLILKNPAKRLFFLSKSSKETAPKPAVLEQNGFFCFPPLTITGIWVKNGIIKVQDRHRIKTFFFPLVRALVSKTGQV